MINVKKTQTACEQQQNYDGSPIKQHHQLATAMLQGNEKKYKTWAATNAMQWGLTASRRRSSQKIIIIIIITVA